MNARRCKYCRGPYPVSDAVAAENPWCRHCLHERIGLRVMLNALEDGTPQPTLPCLPIMGLLLLLLSACSFSYPSETLDGASDWALIQTLPTPGARPESFLCTLGNLTVWGDDEHVTSFQVEGKEPVHVWSGDEIWDVHMSGVLVIVVGDLLVVGESWIRLGECE